MVADYQSVVFKHQALLDIWTVALLRVCIVVMGSSDARASLISHAHAMQRARGRCGVAAESLAGLAVGVVD